MDPVTLGLIILAFGGFIFGGVYFYLRRMKQDGRSSLFDRSKAGRIQLPSGNQSLPMLLVHQGGRVTSINQRARELLDIDEEEKPNLENIAKQIRPNEAFFSLCTEEGNAQLSMKGRLIRVNSHRLLYDGVNLMLIEFIEKKEQEAQGAHGLGPEILEAYQELTELIDVHDAIQPAVQKILENIEFLLPADKIEFYLLEKTRNHLSTYRLAGSPGDNDRLETLESAFHADKRLLGHIFKQKYPLLIEDIHEVIKQHNLEVESDQEGEAVTCLGIPLAVAEETLGMVLFQSGVKGAFSQQDLHIARLLGPQIRNIIHNVSLREKEARRINESSNLLELIQGFTTLFETRNLYASLVKIISSLVPVEVLGFLIYDESKQSLVGKQSFQGLPPEFIEIYSTHIPTNSEAEKLLINQQPIITEDATNSLEWETLGLIHLSQAASLIETVLIPLVSAGRMLGYLQASNHVGDSRPFDESEINLLKLAAAQAAPIIENTHLIKENVEQSQHAVSLRRVSNLISSSGETEDIVRLCLRELSFSFEADFVFLFLLDTSSSVLTLHPSSLFGKEEKFPQDFKELMLGDPQFSFSVTGNLHPNSILTPDQKELLIPYYLEIVEQWKIESAIIAPLVVQDQGIGELWLASKVSSHFNQSDILLLSSIAVQLAAMFENTHLRSLTDEVTKRKIEYYQTLRQIGFELSASPNLDYLLQLIFDESIHSTVSDEGTILFVEQKDSNVGYEINSFVGNPRFEELSQFEVDLLNSGKPAIIEDIDTAAIWKPNKRVRSALLAPIRNELHSIGIISLFSTRQKHYDMVMLEMVQALAVHAGTAVGIEKTKEDFGAQSDHLSQELKVKEAIYQISCNLKWDQPLIENLGGIADAIQNTASFQKVCFGQYSEQEKTLTWVYAKGLSPEHWEDLQSRQYQWKEIEYCLQPEFQVGGIFIIPAVYDSEILEELRSKGFETDDDDEPGFDTWETGDLILVPLLTDSGSPLGLISLDAPQQRKRPGPGDFEILASFALLSKIILLNHLFTRSREDQLSNLEQLRVNLQGDLNDARQKIEHLSSELVEREKSFLDHDQQVNWLNAVPNILIATQQQSDRESYLQILVEQLLQRLTYDAAIITTETPSGPRLVISSSNLKNDENIEVLLGQNNPIGQIFSTETIEVVEDVSRHDLWHDNPLLTSLEVQSYLLFPIRIDGEQILAILLIRYQPSGGISAENIRVIERLSNLLGNGLRNLQHLQDTTVRLGEVNSLLAFNKKLDSLDPDRILNALLENVVSLIPAADVAWIGLWDERNQQLKPVAAAGYSNKEALLNIRFMEDFQSKTIKDEELSLPLQVLRHGGSKHVADVQFAKDYHLTPTDLILYRQATSGSLPASTLIVELRRSDHQMGVLVMDTLDSPQSFTKEDNVLATSLTQQTALALENARLFRETDRRSSQLLKLSEATTRIASTMKVEELKHLILEYVNQIIPFDTATLWFREEKILRIAAVMGFKDMESRIGLSVAIEDSILFQGLDETRQPIIVADIRQDQRFPSLAYPEHLSWLGIPMIAKSELIGVIALEKKEIDFYSIDQVSVGMTFASQAALSLTNARLLEESIQRNRQLDQRSNRLSLLNKLSSELIGSLKTDHILMTTIEQLKDALNLSIVAAVLINEEKGFILTAEIPYEGEFSPSRLEDAPLLHHLQESLGIFSSSDVGAENDLEPLTKTYFKPRGIESLLIIPLETSLKIIGWLWLQMDHSYRFTSSEMGLARTMANQAAIAIQNAMLLSETQRLTNDLEEIVQERTHELHEEHQNTQTLLKMINQLSESMDMEIVLEKTLDVVRKALKAKQCLIILADSAQKMYSSGTNLLDVGDDHHLSRHAPESDISAWVIENRSSILIKDISKETRWKTRKEMAYKSVLGVPLILEENILGTLFVLHSDEAVFSEEKISFVEAAARQISIALNNANLFELANDQAIRLTTMLHHQEIQSSRSLAILEAVADGVLVTDEKNLITLYNTSAEKILGVQSAQVLGKSLVDFERQLSIEKTYWLETITRWSKAPEAILEGDNFAQQLNLEDSRIVLVHLAPVKSGDNFLGTVSILRDVTQEVLVDRLKSDFVANVSHELRTPLTSIKGYADLMVMGAIGQLSDQQMQFLKVIRDNTKRLNVLVNDLLDISHIDAGQLALSFEQIDLIGLSEKVLQDISHFANEENKAIRFTLECPDSLPLVSGDEEKIRQILNNLINNAYHYTPDGGDVIVRLQQKYYDIQIDVIDNGIGIKQENSGRIFERFYRGENPLVLATAGTGLGLAISKILIEMHGGRIWFESSGIEGEGSVFSFTLPLELRTVT